VTRRVKREEFDPAMRPIPREEEEEFWDAYEFRRAIRDHARASRAAPWATYAATMARGLALVPPNVVINSFGHVSLNSFVALVGKTGGGKGKATRAAERLVPFEYDEVTTAGVGSGEGIPHLYMHRVKGEVERIGDRALIDVGEIDTLAGISSRMASIVLPELRKVWFAEWLGAQNADPAKRLPVPAQTYRLALIAGAQPTRAGVLLDDADGGTPQRFLWFTTLDPDVPQGRPEWDEPEPLKIRSLADEPRAFLRAATEDPNRPRPRGMDVCATAMEMMDQDAVLNLGGKGSKYPAHALLARLKVAAWESMMTGHVRDITEEAWEDAGTVMRVSNWTLAQVEQEVREARQKATWGQGKAEGIRQVASDESYHAGKITRVRGVITRRLEHYGSQTKQQLRDATGRDKEYFVEALELLLKDGEVMLDGSKYALA
jgi:hypothetical protein